MIQLYQRFRGNGNVPTIGLSFLKKIKFEHVYLTSFSKRRINMGTQVCYIISIIPILIAMSCMLMYVGP